MSARLRWRLVAALGLLLGCGTAHDGRVDDAAGLAVDASTSSPDVPTRADSSAPDAFAPPDAAAGVRADRGPTRMPVDGDPNGLFWDAATSTLFIADDNGNRILRFRDGEGLGFQASLPATSARSPGLGQVVRLADGTLVVTRFGFGAQGDVAVVAPDGTGRIVPGLDPERRRIGLTVTDDGRLFDAWFTRIATGERVGAVGALTLDGTEREVVTGLRKPVGVVAQGDTLFISDQEQSRILKAPLADLTLVSLHAEVPEPDLLAAGPGGALFTGSVGGNLYRVDASGRSELVQSGFQSVRGVAYDPANRRLFIVDHDEDESDGIRHLIHILPID